MGPTLEFYTGNSGSTQRRDVTDSDRRRTKQYNCSYNSAASRGSSSDGANLVAVRPLIGRKAD